MDRNPALGFDKLLHNLALGNRDAALVSSIASRIARLNQRLSKPDREELEAIAGMPLKKLAENLVDALDPDFQYNAVKNSSGASEPSPEAIANMATQLIDAAVAPLADKPAFREKLVELRRSYDQVIDETSADILLHAGYSKDAADRARQTVESFRAYIDEYKDEITALQILYSRPYKQRITWSQVKELASAIGRTPQRWTPENLWAAYEALDKSKVRGSGPRVLADIIQIIRFTIGLDDQLTSFPDVVNDRFTGWLLAQRQAGRAFSDEQMQWLGRIRDHVAASLTISKADFDYTPFTEHGGLGKAHAIFGTQLDDLLTELSKELVA